MKKVKIGEAIQTGWSVFMKRPWYLFGLALAVMGLFAATSSQALAAALAYIVYGGFTGVLIKHYNGEAIVFDDVFTIDTQKWISFAFLAVIQAIFIILGFICFIIPGVYLAVRWMFAGLLVIDKGLRPMEALKASSKLTEGVRWKLFLFSLAMLPLFVLGFLFFIVGFAVAMLVCIFATIKIYKDLQAAEVATVAMPEIQQ